jgi:hypothetical protein
MLDGISAMTFGRIMLACVAHKIQMRVKIQIKSKKKIVFQNINLEFVEEINKRIVWFRHTVALQPLYLDGHDFMRNHYGNAMRYDTAQARSIKQEYTSTNELSRWQGTDKRTLIERSCLTFNIAISVVLTAAISHWYTSRISCHRQ